MSFSLILFSCLLGAHLLFREKMASPDRFQAHFAHLEEARDQAELRAKLVQHQLAEFQTQVATLMPEALKMKAPEGAYPLRQLASVVTDSDSLNVERASSLFDRAKNKFRDQEFEESNRAFTELIEQYPESVHVVESYFLLAEGQYQARAFDESAATIEKMMTLFPENDLTGFALLRLGRIYEKQDRLEDATDIYRAVLSNFKKPELVHQAEVNLKAVAL